jgi:hypothetical protein
MEINTGFPNKIKMKMRLAVKPKNSMAISQG